MDYRTQQHDLQAIARALAVAFDLASISSSLDAVRTWRPNEWWPAPRAAIVDNHLRPTTLTGKGLSVWDLGCDLDLVLDTGHARLHIRANPTEVFCTSADLCRCDVDRLAEANDLCEGVLGSYLDRSGQHALSASLLGRAAV
jgi:hypothetical protein